MDKVKRLEALYDKLEATLEEFKDEFPDVWESIHHVVYDCQDMWYPDKGSWLSEYEGDLNG